MQDAGCRSQLDEAVAAWASPRAAQSPVRRDTHDIFAGSSSRNIILASASMPASRLPPHRFRIDHHLDAAIAGPAGVGGVRDDRVAAAVADDEELPRRHAACARQRVVDGHRLGDGQVLIGRKLRRGHRAAVGVAFDADHLLRIVLRQVGGDAPQQRSAPFLSCAVPRLNS